jgi:hypothetical protein
MIGVLKDFIWKTFEDTGDINSYMFYREIDRNEEELFKKSNAAGKETAAIENNLS